MAPRDQAIPEALYRNAINLNRYSNGVARRVIDAYNDIILDASFQLAAIDEVTSPGTTLRLRTLLAQLQIVLALGLLIALLSHKNNYKDLLYCKVSSYKIN